MQCAGEAHWQLGIVERHMATLTEMIQKMILDAPNPSGMTLQNYVDLCTEAKNAYARYGDSSPSQWLTGRGYPLFENADVVTPDLPDETSSHYQFL